jgi:hypothetical protein
MKILSDILLLVAIFHVYLKHILLSEPVFSLIRSQTLFSLRGLDRSNMQHILAL